MQVFFYFRFLPTEIDGNFLFLLLSPFAAQLLKGKNVNIIIFMF